MHPIEHLRWLARVDDISQARLVAETADALWPFANEANALLISCRSLLNRQPTSGPLVWLAAHMLTSTDPRKAANDCVQAMATDQMNERAHYLVGEMIEAGQAVDAVVEVLAVGPDKVLVGGDEVLMMGSEVTAVAVGAPGVEMPVQMWNGLLARAGAHGRHGAHIVDRDRFAAILLPEGVPACPLAPELY